MWKCLTVTCRCCCCCSLLVPPAAFLLTATWLSYTASPHARADASCCGSNALCVDYTCDLTWDILLLFFWALMLAAVAGGLAFYSKLVEFMNGKNQVLQVDFYLTSTTKMSKGAEMFVDNGKIILIVAVVLAAIMVVSLIITAALSAANRSTLRGEDMQVVLPVHQAPKQVVMMVTNGQTGVQSVMAKPIAY
jgi:hypothetical protein